MICDWHSLIIYGCDMWISYIAYVVKGWWFSIKKQIALYQNNILNQTFVRYYKVNFS